MSSLNIWTVASCRGDGGTATPPPLGLGTEFRSAKILRNRLERFPYSAEESAHSKAFRGFTAKITDTELRECFLLRNAFSEQNSESFLLFLFHETEFWAFFSLAEWFGTKFREFSVPLNSRNFVGTNHLCHLFRLPLNYFFGQKFLTLPSTQDFLGLNVIDMLNLHYSMKRGCNHNLF